MNRAQLLKIVNIGLGLLFLNMAITGTFPNLVPYPVFEVVHQKGGKVFVVFAIAHIVLNWGWIKAKLIRRPAKASR